MSWEGLNPPYATIVADPPWPIKQPKGWHSSGNGSLPYSTLNLAEINDFPVSALAADYCHLYLWTVNKHIHDAYGVAASWGFTPSTMLVWCKPPRGVGPGREFTITTEFVLLCKRGNGHAWGGSLPERKDSTWFQWPRGHHSVKPAAFYDLVEQVSPGPYVELFARQQRLGWDSWGFGFELDTLTHKDSI